jgi:hypothetical protein
LETLRFTTRVLGSKAAHRLEDFEVTQTIRSRGASICLSYFNGRIKSGDIIKVLLDDRLVGVGTFISLEAVKWHNLDINDARRGGFDNRFELASALRRAGYRFSQLEDYFFYRCLFSWPESEELVKVLEIS